MVTIQFPERELDEIIQLVAQKFRTFGGDKDPGNNPIAIALKGRAPQFAAGVDVEEVVRFVLEQIGRF